MPCTVGVTVEKAVLGCDWPSAVPQLALRGEGRGGEGVVETVCLFGPVPAALV
jgi:hypothetical protein